MARRRKKYYDGDGKGRSFGRARWGEDTLGPLKQLPGVWKGKGTGWNMIALPFEQGPFRYRILMNQYDECLKFTTVSSNVENRGLADVIEPNPKVNAPSDHDQFVVALDYEQTISQVAVADDPPSDGLTDIASGSAGSLRGPIDKPIHHEPGLWLHMKNLRATDKDFNGSNARIENADLQVARLATIPHGNAFLALGTATTDQSAFTIPPVSGLPIGRFEDLASPGYDVLEDNGDGCPDPYLAPYRRFIENPFFGTAAGVKDFPGFNPVDMNQILRFANRGVKIKKTTILQVDTTRRQAGIHNIPFAISQAEPASMKSTFWIHTLKDKHKDGTPRMRLQYSQVVMLDFFLPREDGLPGKARWPHISIATLEYKRGASRRLMKMLKKDRICKMADA